MIALLARQEPVVVGHDRRQARRCREAQQVIVDEFLFLVVVILELEEDIALAEDLDEPQDDVPLPAEIAVHHRLGRLAAHAAGEHDEALRVPREILPRHARLSARGDMQPDEGDQVAVPLVRLGESREVIHAAPVEHRRVGQLGAEHRPDPDRRRLPRELVVAPRGPVVGEPDRLHAEKGGALDGLAHREHALEGTVYAVHVKRYVPHCRSRVVETNCRLMVICPQGNQQDIT